jgi:hypothetical protein
MVRVKTHIIWISTGQRPGASGVTLVLAGTVHGRARPWCGVDSASQVQAPPPTRQVLQWEESAAVATGTRGSLHSRHTHDDHDVRILLLLLLLLLRAASLRGHTIAGPRAAQVAVN